MDKFDFIEQEFERRRQKSQVRRLREVVPLEGARVSIDGQSVLNFCSNDYLGLSRHPLLTQRAGEFMSRYGAGTTASRLICGNYACFKQVEEKLARLKQTESALILNAGFQANATILPVLCDEQTLLLSDQLNHNSLIHGCRLSRGTTWTFAHNDMSDLEKKLLAGRQKNFSRMVIVTETIFSMDGDVCDLEKLLALAEEFEALLVVDEAHATGVVGENGMGLAAGKKVDVVIGTFGKGCGSFGAYVACSARMREYLINCCAGVIYSTALPPAVIGEIDAALDLIPQMETERQQLQDLANYLRSRLAEMGLATGDSASQIIPVLLGGEQQALELAQFLEQQGFLAVAIRPPTVPPGASRIRISLSALHTMDEVELLAAAIEQWRSA